MAQDNRKRVEDFAVLAYAFLGAISLLAFLAGGLLEGEVRSVLFGIGTEILGATVIFLFVEKIVLRRNFDLIQLLEHVAERLDGKTHFLRKIEDNLQFDKLIADAIDISLVSNSLSRLLKTYEGELRGRLEAGAHIKLLLLDPKGASCKLFSRHSKKKFINEIEGSLDIARSLKSFSENIGRGKVSIRVIDWPASCSMHLIDPEKDFGYIRVTIHTLHPAVPLTHRAHFLLSRAREPSWYRSYFEQFQTLWDGAEIVG